MSHRTYSPPVLESIWLRCRTPHRIPLQSLSTILQDSGKVAARDGPQRSPMGPKSYSTGLCCQNELQIAMFETNRTQIQAPWSICWSCHLREPSCCQGSKTIWSQSQQSWDPKHPHLLAALEHGRLSVLAASGSVMVRGHIKIKQTGSLSTRATDRGSGEARKSRKQGMEEEEEEEATCSICVEERIEHTLPLTWKSIFHIQVSEWECIYILFLWQDSLYNSPTDRQKWWFLRDSERDSERGERNKQKVTVTSM